jgi:tetratricopeptide (TPR) repeat protein
VMVRFGLWNDILTEPEKYTDKMWFTRAFHGAARAIAFAAKSDTANARNEQRIFLERTKLVPKEASLGNNSCEAILGVVTPMVEGEILVAEGQDDRGIEQLRAAIQKEDALKYDEPPGWLIPVRHSLGAVLMKQQRFAEAEQVYRKDLARLPDNGWSLFGLAETLRRQSKNADEASETQVKVKKGLGKSRPQDYHFVFVSAAVVRRTDVLSAARRITVLRTRPPMDVSMGSVNGNR